MTYEEAIKQLNSIAVYHFDKYTANAIDMAIDALEKQIPKKPTGQKTLGDIADYLIANGVTVHELNGCKYCKEYEDLPEHFIDGKPVGRVFDTCIQRNENAFWHLEVPYGADIGIRFCPMCGRELLQPPKGE